MQERLFCPKCTSQLLVIPTPGCGTVGAVQSEARFAGGGTTEYRTWRAPCARCGRGYRLGFDDSVTWEEYIADGPGDLGIGQCPRCRACFCEGCADRSAVAAGAPKPWLRQRNPLKKPWWQFW